MKTLLFLALLLPLAVGAQVKKCTIDGQRVYSDSLCGQYGVIVDARPNSIDTSAMRAHAAKVEKQEKAEQAKQQAQAARDAKARSRKGPCDGIIDLSHAPSARQRNEFKRCQDGLLREYNRPTY